MSQHVDAIYEDGVLKPLAPVDLKDHELVSLSIDRVAENGSDTSDDGLTFFELFDEAKLIGCVNDAPSDLSTNPKYMERFGKSGH